MESEDNYEGRQIYVGDIVKGKVENFMKCGSPRTVTGMAFGSYRTQKGELVVPARVDLGVSVGNASGRCVGVFPLRDVKIISR